MNEVSMIDFFGRDSVKERNDLLSGIIQLRRSKAKTVESLEVVVEGCWKSEVEVGS